MDEPASLRGNLDVEASTIVAGSPIVDAEEERSSLLDSERFALANKEEPTRHDAHPRGVLGAIDRIEARVLLSRQEMFSVYYQMS